MILRFHILRYLAVGLEILVQVFSSRRDSEMARVFQRRIRALPFPETSTMGIFFALAVPLEAPSNSISLSYFFEATYPLPQNSTDFEPYVIEGRGNERDRRETYRKRRPIDRITIYATVENKFRSFGLPGRECLLRTICETSQFTLHHNGIVGDVVHVIFTPSTSRSENLPRDVHEAESIGRSGNCSKYHDECPVGLFDLIAILM